MAFNNALPPQDLTSSNVVLTIAVDQVATAGVQIQGYGVDEAIAFANVEIGNAELGVDGNLATYRILSTRQQTITLMAGSPACLMFEDWMLAEQQSRSRYLAQGTLILPGLGRKYDLINGSIRSIDVASSSGKSKQKDRQFVIQWQYVNGSSYRGV